MSEVLYIIVIPLGIIALACIVVWLIIKLVLMIIAFYDDIFTIRRKYESVCRLLVDFQSDYENEIDNNLYSQKLLGIVERAREALNRDTR